MYHEEWKIFHEDCKKLGASDTYQLIIGLPLCEYVWINGTMDECAFQWMNVCVNASVIECMWLEWMYRNEWMLNE